MSEETIAAISTAWGEAGIAIIRLSGPASRQLADEVVQGVRPLAETSPRFLRNGFLLDENKEPIDQVLFSWFKAPKSYTGEDMVEISTHGGTLVAQKCLERLISKGAVLAEPGEFTKRAFLNGKIDLSQAEAVLGIIRSKSEEALRAATRTLRGELSSFARDIYNEIMEISASIEVGLDFPEEDIPYMDSSDVEASLSTLKQSLEDLLDRCNTGFLLREGIRVALVGRPNVGKSSLLNALLKESRAIVTSVPGTTRDVIEEVLTYRGIPIRLIDTAGIDAPSDEIEAIGIARAEKAMAEADIRVWVIDGSEPFTPADLAFIPKLSSTNHIVAINKSDLPLVISEEMVSGLLPQSLICNISAEKREGIETLKDTIVANIAGGGTLTSGLNASSRQVEEIRRAIQSLAQSVTALEEGLGQDIVATCLYDARGCMERLLGLSIDDALLDTIFSQFCVGK